MDSGSYNHIRRATMSHAPAASTAASSSMYKTNMNRTKTRKWVEAKVQSYDGDDWGNDYDDYGNDYDNDQHDAPEPKSDLEPLSPTSSAGLRQFGQTGHQLPSSRTFPSNAAPRMFNLPSRRGSDFSVAPLRHAQTQPSVALPTSVPLTEKRRGSAVSGFLAGERAVQLPAVHEPIIRINEPVMRPFGPRDGEVKADILKSRRLSTSPQLPGLKRLSGFGDDLFGQHAGINHASRLEEPHLPSDELHMNTDTIGHAGNQISGSLEESAVVNEQINERVEDTSGVAAHPQLPGAWVSESSTDFVSSKSTTPLSEQDARTPTPLARVGNAGNAGNASAPSITESCTDVSSEQPALKLETATLPAGTLDKTSNEKAANKPHAAQQGRVAGQHHDAILVPSEASATAEHHQTIQSPHSLEATNLLGQPSLGSISTVSTITQSPSLQQILSPHSPASTSTGSEIIPTAPLNPNRIETAQPEYYLPVLQQRQSTDSTIETGSPQKESDKLREEIIKSLSPPPIAPGPSTSPISGTFDAEPNTGSSTRDSTYLAGVYDDYLSSSPADENSIQERSRTLKPDTDPSPNRSLEEEKKSTLASQGCPVQAPLPNTSKNRTMEETTKSRRFSWEEEPEELKETPVEPKSAVPMLPPESPVRDARDLETKLETKLENTTSAVSQFSDSLFAEAGWTDSISNQLSQVGSCAPGDASAVNGLASPISLTAAKDPKPLNDELNLSHISLADEKEKELAGEVQSGSAYTSAQHPAFSMGAEQEPQSPSISSAGPASGASASQSPLSPTPFREILNFGTAEERIRKFDETREQFFAIDSGLSDWLAFLQSQPDHTNAAAASDTSELTSMPGMHTVPTAAPAGAPNASQASHKTGYVSGFSQRRKSIGHMQQLLTGQASGLGASGNQMGTKSKELLHAAGAFGNKGVKSGMKLFNKGKSKLRERAGGDKAFF